MEDDGPNFHEAGCDLNVPDGVICDCDLPKTVLAIEVEAAEREAARWREALRRTNLMLDLWLMGDESYNETTIREQLDRNRALLAAEPREPAAAPQLGSMIHLTAEQFTEYVAPREEGRTPALDVETLALALTLCFDEDPRVFARMLAAEYARLRAQPQGDDR
jgi:hypothetical protein